MLLAFFRIAKAVTEPPPKNIDFKKRVLRYAGSQHVPPFASIPYPGQCSEPLLILQIFKSTGTKESGHCTCIATTEQIGITFSCMRSHAKHGNEGHRLRPSSRSSRTKTSLSRFSADDLLDGSNNQPDLMLLLGRILSPRLDLIK